ncbi:MAG: hypothetical protein WC438_01690 [Candidatus Pacearchaeota archaeon]
MAKQLEFKEGIRKRESEDFKENWKILGITTSIVVGVYSSMTIPAYLNAHPEVIESIKNYLLNIF